MYMYLSLTGEDWISLCLAAAALLLAVGMGKPYPQLFFLPTGAGQAHLLSTVRSLLLLWHR